MKCVLIGGGNTTDSRLPYETEEIDKEVVKLTNKENPTFLFIGLASTHSDSKYDHIKVVFKNLGCTTEYLKKSNLMNNPNIVEDKIKRADIIYIAGGDTIKLMNSVKEFNLEPLLKEALDSDTVIAGKSAGAILLCNSGFSDSYILRGESEHYKMISGLGFIDIEICPHYHENEQKTKELQEYLKDNNDTVYGIENSTALLIQNNEIKPFLTNDNKIYICNKKGETEM